MGLTVEVEGLDGLVSRLNGEVQCAAVKTSWQEISLCLGVIYWGQTDQSAKRRM